ncbi:MAG: response regulator [Acidobacteriota bacterium]
MPRVLLADHHPTSRRIVELSFAEEDVEVVSFDDGAAALDCLRSSAVDLVLADVSLPAVNGYELCRAVHSDARIARVPVILMVGRFDPFDMQMAEEVGYHSRLTKPIEPHNLIDLVRRLTAADQPEAAQSTAGGQPAVLLSALGERSSGMLFDVPLAEGTQNVVFPLKVYQCEPAPALIRRDVFEAPQEPLADVASAPDPAPEPEPAVDVAPAPPADDQQVDRVMNKLAEKLPAMIRAILQEEKGQ